MSDTPTLAVESTRYVRTTIRDLGRRVLTVDGTWEDGFGGGFSATDSEGVRWRVETILPDEFSIWRAE